MTAPFQPRTATRRRAERVGRAEAEVRARLSAGILKWRRAAIYVRVSTGDQHVEQQVEALRRWIEPMAAEIEVLKEKETASGKRARPVFEELLRRARRREIDALIVWKLDRAFRTCREAAMWLDESRGLAIDFLSYTEGWDTSTPMGRAMFHVAAAFAELERENISERTKARLAYLKSKGVRLGAKPMDLDMGRVRRLVAKGLSVRQLARALRVSVGKAFQVKRETRGTRGRKDPPTTTQDRASARA